MPKDNDKHLDPAGERDYVVNHSTRMVHSTSSTDPRCAPRETDNPGWGNDLENLEAQGFVPCPLCLPGRFK